jgi:hypothetical protein
MGIAFQFLVHCVYLSLNVMIVISLHQGFLAACAAALLLNGCNDQERQSSAATFHCTPGTGVLMTGDIDLP